MLHECATSVCCRVGGDVDADKEIKNATILPVLRNSHRWCFLCCALGIGTKIRRWSMMVMTMIAAVIRSQCRDLAWCHADDLYLVVWCLPMMDKTTPTPHLVHKKISSTVFAVVVVVIVVAFEGCGSDIALLRHLDGPGHHPCGARSGHTAEVLRVPRVLVTQGLLHFFVSVM